MLWRMLRGLVAVAAACTMTGCSASKAYTGDRSTTPSTAQATSSATAPESTSSTALPTVPPTGGAGYSAVLSARLLAKDSVPSGYTVKITTVMSSDAGDQRPPADASCSDGMIPLLSATQLTGTPTAKAAATLSNDTDPDHFWVGYETLRTYTGNGAQQAVTNLRSFIGRCPTAVSSGQGADRFRFAVAPGPQLGDDSIRVSCSMTYGSEVLECDSVIIRIGTALMMVQEQGDDPGASSDHYLTELAEAAAHRYQATSS